MITVMLVEDDREFAKIVEGMLAESPGIQLMGSFGSGAELDQALRERQPKVLVMDHHLPDHNGLEMLPALREAFPEMEILFLTVERDSRVIFQALNFGATGYLLKMRGISLLPEAIFELANGRAVMSPEIAKLALQFFKGFNTPERPPFDLAPREFEIISLLADGKLIKEVADKLGISVGNVKNACHKAYKKLQVERKADAISKLRPFFPIR